MSINMIGAMLAVFAVMATIGITAGLITSATAQEQKFMATLSGQEKFHLQIHKQQEWLNLL